MSSWPSAAPDYQRLAPLQTDATADKLGNAVFVFPAIPSTRERWGSLTCPAAPAGALFALSYVSGGIFLGSLIGLWAGPNTWGPILVPGMLTPAVTASGLVPGQAYLLSWWGYEGMAGIAESVSGSIYPQPSASQPLVL